MFVGVVVLASLALFWNKGSVSGGAAPSAVVAADAATVDGTCTRGDATQLKAAALAAEALVSGDDGASAVALRAAAEARLA